MFWFLPWLRLYSFIYWIYLFIRCILCPNSLAQRCGVEARKCWDNLSERFASAASHFRSNGAAAIGSQHQPFLYKAEIQIAVGRVRRRCREIVGRSSVDGSGSTRSHFDRRAYGAPRWRAGRTTTPHWLECPLSLSLSLQLPLPGLQSAPDNKQEWRERGQSESVGW